ncbi:hypothetical protein OF83DRAFT_1179471 [Amylostereum chailletii]|nr:hypothetical protein OF83DRAFT_1179471 [Amylostereum chailletii]
MDKTKAYVINMFIHPGLRLSWIRSQWDAHYISEAENTIRQLVPYEVSRHF